jgi:hypothetical protein
MKRSGHLVAAVVCVATLVLPRLAAAQTPTSVSASGQVQVPIPKTPADVPGPVPGNTMTNAYVQLVGRMVTKPGFYIIVGPHWTGEVPKGITAAITFGVIHW